MKQIDPLFQSHLDGEVLTLCNCWQIHRRDGLVLGFTDHDRDIAFDGVLHEAMSGFEASRMEESGALSPESHDLAGALQSERVTEADILSRRYDGARVHHLIVNWSAPDERVLMRTMMLGEINRLDGAFRAEVHSLTGLLDQTSYRRYDKACSASLGDAGCGVNLEPLRLEGLVLAVRKPDVIAVSGIAGLAAGWFRGGRIAFTSGANAGLSIEIAEHLSGMEPDGSHTLRLWSELPSPPVAGDGISITPGCDKQFSTCREKFANGLNFRGFPHLPGPDFAMSHAANADRLDGKPVIP